MNEYIIFFGLRDEYYSLSRLGSRKFSYFSCFFNTAFKGWDWGGVAPQQKWEKYGRACTETQYLQKSANCKKNF